MPRTLKDIAKEGKAKKEQKRQSSTQSQTTTPPSSTALTPSNGTSTPTVSVVVEGQKINIPDKFDLTSVSSKLPSFDASKYDITDASNPPESLPQISEADYQKASGKYDSTKRVLSLEQQAVQVVGEQYKVLGARFKAFGEGVKAATEAEKIEQLLTEYSIQKETNTQKNEILVTSRHQTTNAKELTTYNKQVSDEQVEVARLKVEDLKIKNKTTREKLTDSGWTDDKKAES